MSFSTLGLSPKVLASVEASGYTQPTPIQEQAIPHVLDHRDVLGIAQTGTGKTAGFVLPMLTLLENGRARARMPRTLILEPTRELAAQVEESFNRYGRNHKLTVALLIGGVSFDDQNKKLDRGVDVLIATPGRLLDHFGRGKLLMNGVEILVIDEADRMLDMGFIPDIERICRLLPAKRQTLFFSATMPPEIQRLADTFLSQPVRVEASRPATAAVTVSQFLAEAGREPADKRAVLRALIRGADDFKNAIIFCNRKRDVAILQRSLARHGFNAGALHGDMDQRARMATLEDFKRDRLTLLVASDVAARGLDIPAVSHIFNFDVPTHSEDYIHRIGRTGRAGLSGTAITIATPIDRKYVAQIEKMTGKAIQPIAVEATAERAAAVYGHHHRDTSQPKDARSEGRGRGERRDRGRHRRNGAAPRAEPGSCSRRPKRRRVTRNRPRRWPRVPSRHTSRGDEQRSPPQERATASRAAGAECRHARRARAAGAKTRAARAARSRPSSASAIMSRASSSAARGRPRHRRPPRRLASR